MLWRKRLWWIVEFKFCCILGSEYRCAQLWLLSLQHAFALSVIETYVISFLCVVFKMQVKQKDSYETGFFF